VEAATSELPVFTRPLPRAGVTAPQLGREWAAISATGAKVTRTVCGSAITWGVQRRIAWLRRAALSLPAAVAVALALVWWSSEQDTRFAAKLYGSLDGGTLAVRAQLFAVTDSAVRSAQTDVVLEVTYPTRAAERLTARRQADVADFDIELDERPSRLRLLLAQPGPDHPRPLAVVDDLELATTAGQPNRRGGWVAGLTHGAIVFDVAVMRGVLAVPFPAELLVRLSSDGKPLARTRLSAELSGAHARPDERSEPHLARLTTDEAGEVRFWLVPQEHVVELTLTVGESVGLAEKGRGRDDVVPGEQPDGRWFGRLPVVPGAMWVQRIGDALEVHSPTERAVAYVHLMRLHGAHWLGAVPLRTSGQDVVGTLPLPTAFADGRGFFAIVSSEADMQSMALVGWPTAFAQVSPTLDTRVGLIADGVLVEQRELEERRAQRARWALWTCGGAAAVECGVLLWLVSRVGRGSGAPRRIPTRVSAAQWAALVCVALGLLGLGLFGLLSP